LENINASLVMAASVDLHNWLMWQLI